MEAEAKPSMLGSTLITGEGLAPLINICSIEDMGGVRLAAGLGLQMSLSLPIALWVIQGKRWRWESVPPSLSRILLLLQEWP